MSTRHRTNYKSVHFMKYLINVDCLGSYNVEQTKIFRKDKFSRAGVCVFVDCLGTYNVE
jgi:hypothetical protein